MSKELGNKTSLTEELFAEILMGYIFKKKPLQDVEKDLGVAVEELEERLKKEGIKYENV